MTPELFQAIEAGGGCVDLSSRAKFLLTGADRVRYLNGQVTNDVRKATRQEAIYACVTSAKGRIEGDVFIHATPDGAGLLLDAEADLREPLGLRLEKYIVADDVTLTDVTDDWKLLHVFGPATSTAESWLASAGESNPRIESSRFGVPGADLWLPASSTLNWGGAMLSAEDFETLRILRGIPRWPHELNAEVFPQEAGLEEKAMDFSKGCYIGQEILSRIKMTGKMPRVLVRWTARNAEVSMGGDTGLPALYYEDENGARHEAGKVTSAARHPLLDRWVGLGYVRQNVAQAHSVLLAGEGAPNMMVDVNLSKA
jgi:folate-binding protein YgfZ